MLDGQNVVKFSLEEKYVHACQKYYNSTLMLHHKSIEGNFAKKSSKEKKRRRLVGNLWLI